MFTTCQICSWVRVLKCPATLVASRYGSFPFQNVVSNEGKENTHRIRENELGLGFHLEMMMVIR
jgi:hypothetical protein